MSIEFDIDAAMRRASESTKGRPATTRRFWLATIGWTLMRSPGDRRRGIRDSLQTNRADPELQNPKSRRHCRFLTDAHYRNGGTNRQARVPDHVKSDWKT